MSTTVHPPIDFAPMFATHDAFRRDLDRLLDAVTAGCGSDPRVLAGWDNFTRQLLLHHQVEDAVLWPRVERAVADQPRGVALVRAMGAEHAQLDPLLRAVDDALDQNAAGLPDLVASLTAVLVEHLTHEEDEALPLIQAVLTVADWRAFAHEMRRRQGVRGAAIWIPWVTDGHDPDDADRFLMTLPAPVRLINRFLWTPRYQRRQLFAHR